MLWNPAYKPQGCASSPEGNQDLFQGPKRTDEVCETGSVVVFTVAGQQTCHSCSTIHRKAHQHAHVKRRTKVNGQYQPIYVRQPHVVDSYKNMSGVDKSDQLIGRYETPRKTNKWWKTLFYRFLDVAQMNSFIMFRDWTEKHPDVPELQRPKSFSQLDFTLELIKQLGVTTQDTLVPLYIMPKTATPSSATHPVVPTWSDTYLNCKKCYNILKKNKTPM